MTISQALTKYPDIETDLLLAHVLRVDKEYLHIHSEEPISKQNLIRYEALCRKRIEGVPVAYLLGYKYFCGLSFKVNPQTLIPRPESEWLVEQAVRYVQSQTQEQKIWRVLDVGTGSGCLIISLAKQLLDKRLKLVAVDISVEALNIAKQNAEAHQADITFQQSDLLEKITGKYDIIFANLPYVPLDDYLKLVHSLKHEPRLAITTEDETWDIYQRFFKQLPDHMTAGSLVLTEIDPKQKTILERSLPKLFPNSKVTFAKDIQGLWRYVVVNN